MLAAWLLVASTIVSCGRPDERDVAPEPLIQAPAGPTPAHVATSPIAGMQPPDPDAASWRGVVVERLAAGRYTYLRLRDDPRWIATTGDGPEVGRGVHVRSLGSRRDFTSPRLGRTFDELVFGVVALDDESTPAIDDRT